MAKKKKKAARKKTVQRKKPAARKKAAAKGSTRQRRSPEQMIADLKARIKEVEQKAAAKELKQSPSVRRTLSIMSSISKALDEADAEKNNSLRHALADARKPLAQYLEARGVRLPKPRLPRGRKPRR